MFEGLLAPTHLIVLLVVAVLLFGSKRIPEVGRSLGAGLRSFQEGVTGTTATPVEPASDSTSGETQ
jgi:sec-independent protein translocase protein TatA